MTDVDTVPSFSFETESSSAGRGEEEEVLRLQRKRLGVTGQQTDQVPCSARERERERAHTGTADPIRSWKRAHPTTARGSSSSPVVVVVDARLRMARALRVPPARPVNNSLHLLVLDFVLSK